MIYTYAIYTDIYSGFTSHAVARRVIIYICICIYTYIHIHT